MKKTKKHVLLKTLIITLIVFTVLIISFWVYIRLNINEKIDLSLIPYGRNSITRIYCYDYEDRANRIGTAVELKNEAVFSEKSQWESIENMPKYLLDAFVSIEDKRFYEHSGVDWLRTLKATANYIFKFDDVGYGGSTITQQLIKNLTGDDNVNVKRKLEEIFRAIDIEKRLSKKQILEAYLNIVYLSANCYGVGAASQVYFNKDVHELTLAECASIASIVQNPQKYDPHINPENNLKRRNLILSEMLKQEYISEAEYNSASREALILNENINNEKRQGISSWFTEALIEDVAKKISEKFGLNMSASRMVVTKGGLKIYSTVEPEIQRKLEDIYETYEAHVLPNQDGSYPESSCVVIDPYTFDVLALVGGKGEKQANMLFNRATDAKRAPGSVIKPLSVYAPLLNEGLINYSTVFDDTPISIVNNSPWPKNSPNRYRGLVSVDYALEHSINTVAVKALEKLGINKSHTYLKRLLIDINDKKDMSSAPLALGQFTNGVSLLNVTNAYAPFVNGGYISEPKTFLYVTDSNDNIILTNGEKYDKIFSESTSAIMTKMLEQVVDTGTARCVTSKTIVPIAGKTGTSGGSNDKWFIGYTPKYLCGVWTGYDTPKTLNYSKNPSCVIFDKLIQRLYVNEETEEEFFLPENIISVEYCMDSGLLPCEECKNDLRGSRIREGYFVEGTEPKDICNLHKKVFIDISDGLIADITTPSWRRRAVSLLDYKRNNEFPDIEILDNEFSITFRERKLN